MTLTLFVAFFFFFSLIELTENQPNSVGVLWINVICMRHWLSVDFTGKKDLNPAKESFLSPLSLSLSLSIECAVETYAQNQVPCKADVLNWCEGKSGPRLNPFV